MAPRTRRIIPRGAPLRTHLIRISGNDAGFGKLQIEALHAAQRLEVEHVVKLSALGASNHSNSAIAREHWEVEQALQQSTMTRTILRPHAFMQNWLGEVAVSVRAEGTIYSPIDDGRVLYIDLVPVDRCLAGARRVPEGGWPDRESLRQRRAYSRSAATHHS